MPRTGENIYRRKDDRWEARMFDDSKGKYRSVYGKTYAEARQKQRAMLARQAQGKPALPKSIVTVEAAALQWEQSVRLKTKESTQTQYSRLLRQHILPHIGGLDVRTIERAQVEQFIGQLLTDGRLDGGGGLSPKTVQDVLVILKNIFKHARGAGVSVGCSLDDILLKRADKEMRVLSKQEQAALTEHLLDNPDAIKIGVMLGLSTGIRLGELCALRWEDVDLINGILHVRRTLQRVPDLSGTGAKTKVIITDPKSKSSTRMIPLSSSVVNALRPFSCRPQAYFLTRDRLRFMEPRTVQNHFKKYLAASGIADANFHALRHTFATRCVEAGFEIKSLSEILGHSSVNITLNKYVHSSFELKREQMEKMPI